MTKHWKVDKLIQGCRIICNIFIVAVILALTVGSPMGVFAKKIIRVGLIFDPSGPLDHTINEFSYQGMMQAEDELHTVVSYYRSDDIGDIENQIRNCAAEGNQLCLSVGFLSTDAVNTVAWEYPSVSFAIIDSLGDQTLPNLRSIWFDYRQAGYLGGVLASRMTATNKLGVVAGMAISPVIDLAEGFRNAVQCNNPAADVWIEYTGTFDEPALGAYWAEQMVEGGADVVYGAAGLTGNGAITRAAQLGARVVGVDYDQYVSLFLGYPYADRILTSTMKNWDVSVYKTVDDFVKDRFTPGTELYGLENGGVELANFHEAEFYIPAEVAKLVEKVEKDLIAGTIDLYDDCR